MFETMKNVAEAEYKMGLLEYFGEQIKWFFRPLKLARTVNFHKIINLTVHNQFTR